MKHVTLLLPVVAAFSLSSCLNKDNRATAGIADEYGMLTVPVPKAKKKQERKENRERFRLKSIGEMTDPMVPEW